MTGRLSFAELLDHHPGQSARDLARKALRQARELMGGDAGLLYLLRHEKGEDRRERAAAQPASEIGETSIAINHPSIVTRVAQTGETIKLNDARAPIAEAPFDTRIDSALGAETGALVAFALSNHAGEIVGVVALGNAAGSGRWFPTNI